MNKIREIRKHAEEQGFKLSNVEIEECKPIHVFLTERLDDEVRTQLCKSLKDLKFTGMKYQLFNNVGAGRN